MPTHSFKYRTPITKELGAKKNRLKFHGATQGIQKPLRTAYDIRHSYPSRVSTGLNTTAAAMLKWTTLVADARSTRTTASSAISYEVAHAASSKQRFRIVPSALLILVVSFR